MSARKRRIVLTQEARGDLRAILLFTEQQWGEAQRRIYRQEFRQAFTQLESFPDLRRLRPEYGPDFRGHRVGQHIVFYQPSGTELRILRILHRHRDFNAELE